MPAPPKARAVQYLRMSTEHQRYSLANQAAAIADFARARHLDVVRTYFDPGKSGLTLQGRAGLQSLLAAVLEPARDFSVVLILDVSRWGRFQDIDQSAHYEFLCRSAGLQVTYCAEPFENDGSAVSSVLKLLKRLMAAEFSRELSVRTASARLRQARLGFHQGGPRAYGVNRVLIDGEGVCRTVLAPGVRKALTTDRVVLRPGPPDELAAVRRIFRRYVRDKRGFATIAHELNADGLRTSTGHSWGPRSVRKVLTDERMVGAYVYNRTSRHLGEPAVRNPPAAWVRVKAFPPIVSPALFRRAQARISAREREVLEEHTMLAALRKLWREKGVLSARLVNSCRYAPAAGTYKAHFGSLSQAFAAIGHVAPPLDLRLSASEEEAMLGQLRDLHARHGYVCEQLINSAPEMPWASTYRHHFGSLTAAYARAGLPHAIAELDRAAYLRSLERGTAYRIKGRSFGKIAPWSDAELLEVLQRLFARDSDISCRTLRDDPALPSVGLYAARFGSFTRAREAAGLPAHVRPRTADGRLTGRRSPAP